MSEPASTKTAAKPASARRSTRIVSQTKPPARPEPAMALATPPLAGVAKSPKPAVALKAAPKPARASRPAKSTAVAKAAPRPVRAAARPKAPFAKLAPDRRRLAQAQLAYLLSEDLGYRTHDLADGVLTAADERDEPQIRRQAAKIRRLLAKITRIDLSVPIARAETATDAQRDRDWKRMRRHLLRRYLLRARLSLELDSLATWLDPDPSVALDAFDGLTANWTDGLFAGARLARPAIVVSDEQLTDQSIEAMLQIPIRRTWQDMTAKPKGKSKKSARKA